HYLAKVLQDLTRRKILRSHRGISGGYALARSSGDITLIDVVRAVDSDTLLQGCILGFEECSSRNPCSLNEQWSRSREGIERLLSTENSAGRAKRMRKPEYRV